MKKSQALRIARKVMEVADEALYDEDRFEQEYGVSHAEVVNALPIISAMELLEDL